MHAFAAQHSRRQESRDGAADHGDDVCAINLKQHEVPVKQVSLYNFFVCVFYLGKWLQFNSIDA